MLERALWLVSDRVGRAIIIGLTILIAGALMVGCLQMAVSRDCRQEDVPIDDGSGDTRYAC